MDLGRRETFSPKPVWICIIIMPTAYDQSIVRQWFFSFAPKTSNTHTIFSDAQELDSTFVLTLSIKMKMFGRALSLDASAPKIVILNIAIQRLTKTS